MKRTLVIGDIHGGVKALRQAIERAAVSDNDILIFLGDYVDGWSESAQTIQYLIELSEKSECIFILGNHDLWCRLWLENGDSNPVWLAHGGEGTRKSYVDTGYLVDKNHKSFFKNLKKYHKDSKNRLFVHAGLTSMYGVEQEFDENNFYWDRTLWESARIVNEVRNERQGVLKIRLNLYHEIYIGHTPTTNYHTDEPINFMNLWNVDTGAAFKGKLSIMDVGTKEFWQSDTVQTLYPDEKGRN